jgi:hypothetical protein
MISQQKQKVEFIMKCSLMLSIVIGFCISACGGSSSSATPAVAVTPPSVTTSTPTTPPPSAVTFTGAFLDSFVEGLSFKTTSGSGITNEKGEFTYQLDEIITFSLGGITFPEVVAKDLITPLDLFSTTDVNEQAVVNTLRLLQSLDTDGDAENGITIADSVLMLAKSVNIDITDVDFESKVANLIENSDGLHTQLISTTDAIYHFEQSLNAYASEGRCPKTHAKVGYSGTFNTLAHNVSGMATIVDDCTIKITEFSYDGGGPLVYFYAAIDHKYENNEAFAIGSQLQGQSYNTAELSITLPDGKSLDDLTGLSVWCADFNADFGNVTFTP